MADCTRWRGAAGRICGESCSRGRLPAHRVPTLVSARIRAAEADMTYRLCGFLSHLGAILPDQQQAQDNTPDTAHDGEAAGELRRRRLGHSERLGTDWAIVIIVVVDDIGHGQECNVRIEQHGRLSSAAISLGVSIRVTRRTYRMNSCHSDCSFLIKRFHGTWLTILSTHKLSSSARWTSGAKKSTSEQRVFRNDGLWSFCPCTE